MAVRVFFNPLISIVYYLGTGFAYVNTKCLSPFAFHPGILSMLYPQCVGVFLHLLFTIYTVTARYNLAFPLRFHRKHDYEMD